MRNVLEDCYPIAMFAVAMVNVRRDRVAGPRTAVTRETDAWSSATETTMSRHDRSTTADKPAKFTRG